MRIHVLIAVLLAGISHVAFALDSSDTGTYAVIHRDGHVTDKVFRLVRSGQNWRVEDKKPNDTWEDVTCEKDCILRESSSSDISRFFSPANLKKITPSCIHNTAFAFCSYTHRDNAAYRGYVLVALVTAKPIHLRLARLSP